MSSGFGVIVLDNEGRVIDYSVPMGIPYNVMREAVSLGYDVYRVVNTIVKELGYKLPRYITVKLDEYEVSIFKRYGKILVVVVYGGDTQPATVAEVKREAVIED